MVEKFKDQLRRGLLDIDPDGAWATSIGMEMNVGQGLVQGGKNLACFRFRKAGMHRPSFGKLAEAVETGRCQLDLHRRFRRWKGQDQPQSFGMGPGTGLSLLRIESSEGRRGTGPPQRRRQGLRATVPMKVLA